MRARRKLSDRFKEIKAGLSELQSFILQDDWRSEVSTFDQKKDKAYKPAFLKDIMDRYSWGSQAIIESHADLTELKFKVVLSESKLAAFIIQSKERPWIFEFLTGAYNDEQTKKFFNDKELSDELKKYLANGEWASISSAICDSLGENESLVSKEIKERYLLAQIKTKQVNFKSKNQELKEEVQAIEAPVAPQPPQPPAKPGLGPSEDVTDSGNEEKIEEAADNTQEKNMVNIKPTKDDDQYENNELIDILDISNPMSYPYKNIGVSPNSPDWPPLGRPYELYPGYNDPNRNVPPESLRIQWI